MQNRTLREKVSLLSQLELYCIYEKHTAEERERVVNYRSIYFAGVPIQSYEQENIFCATITLIRYTNDKQLSNMDSSNYSIKSIPIANNSCFQESTNVLHCLFFCVRRFHIIRCRNLKQPIFVQHVL